MMIINNQKTEIYDYYNDIIFFFKNKNCIEFKKYKTHKHIITDEIDIFLKQPRNFTTYIFKGGYLYNNLNILLLNLNETLYIFYYKYCASCEYKLPFFSSY